MISFSGFLPNKLQEAFKDTINIDLSTYYVYFIVYPSPSNPKQDNLYVGVKHLDSGSDQEHSAKDFFGGIRSTGSSNIFTDRTGKTFENFIVGFNGRRLISSNNKSLSDNNKSLYMSSCKDKQPEALKNAYALGLYDEKEEYHPLICNNNILKFAKEKLRIGMTLEYYFKEKIDEFLSSLKKKAPEEKSDKAEKENNYANLNFHF